MSSTPKLNYHPHWCNDCHQQFFSRWQLSAVHSTGSEHCTQMNTEPYVGYDRAAALTDLRARGWEPVPTRYSATEAEGGVNGKFWSRVKHVCGKQLRWNQHTWQWRHEQHCSQTLPRQRPTRQEQLLDVLNAL